MRIFKPPQTTQGFALCLVFLFVFGHAAIGGERAAPTTPAATPSSVLQVGSYTIQVLSSREVINASSEAGKTLPGFQVSLENVGPQYLLVHDGTRMRVEDLDGPSHQLAELGKALFRQVEARWPEWKRLPAFFGYGARAAINRTLADSSGELTSEEMGLGLVLTFLFANWLFLILGSIVFGERIWKGGECLRRAPFRSLFFASLVACGLLLTAVSFMISVIGLPFAGFLFCGFWFLLVFSAGTVSTGISGILVTPHSLFWRMLLLAVTSPLVFAPLLFPDAGIVVTAVLLLWGFGGLILSGFPETQPISTSQGG